jgi:hypothetical protein
MTKLAQKQKGTTMREIVASVREKHQEVIRLEKDDLIDLGLSSIVTSVGNLNWQPKTGKQGELFFGYNLLRIVTLPNGIKKSLAILTKSEFERYVNDRRIKPLTRSKRTPEWQRAFEFIRPYGAADWTVKACWDAAQAQSQARQLPLS